MTLGLTGYAKQPNNNVDYIMYQQKLKSKISSLLKEHYRKGNIDLANTNIEREVIIDKTNDLETIKLSFEKPVVIYEEKLYTDYEEGLYTNNVSTNSNIETKASTRVISFSGINISCSARIDAYYIGDEWYKMTYTKTWWSTDNPCYGDSDYKGGYVEENYFHALQAGLPYDENCDVTQVYVKRTRNWTANDDNGSYPMYYSPETYTYSAGPGGVCGIYYEFQCRFVKQGYPDCTESWTNNIGWGELGIIQIK